MLTRPQVAPLRFIAARMALNELEKVAREPGVAESLRLTIKYHDSRHPDQVATLVRMQASSAPVMTLTYRRTNDTLLSLKHTIPLERYRAFDSALRYLGFDKLDDPPNIPWFGADLWLLERAAVAFHHDMILPPEQVSGVHAEIIRLLREHLPEAMRAINS